MTHPFLHLPSLAWVAAGGTLGVAAREGLILAMPGSGPLPLAVVVANVVGAFALGLLYVSLDRRAAAAAVPPARAKQRRHASKRRLPRGRQLRLLLGTGFCGGFTTYSTLAVGVVLLGAGSPGPVSAAAWGLGVVLAGALATWAGIAVGTTLPDAREPQAEFRDLPDTPDYGGKHQ